MKSNGCLDAIMLDAGGSSQMYDGKKYYQSERRRVAYWICVWYKKDAVQKPVSPAPVACPYPIPTATLRRGNTGNAVRWVQWHLAQTVTPTIKADGIFGTGTQRAVKKFQAKYGLDVDGIVGPATRKKMQEVCHG